jgi:hypothetical protein
VCVFVLERKSVRQGQREGREERVCVYLCVAMSLMNPMNLMNPKEREREREGSRVATEDGDG